MHQFLIAFLILALVGCSPNEDAGAAVSADADSYTQPNDGAVSGADAQASGVAFWELASPWTTKLRNKS